MQRLYVPAAVLALLVVASLAGCTSSEPTLVLTTSPSDATVSIDGFAHPGSSPHDIEFKSAGRYKLTVTAPGYQPVEMFVSIGPGERRTQTVELVSEQLSQIAGPDDPNQDPPLPPPPIDPPPQIAGGTFTLQVSSTPAGAMVTTREPGQPSSVPVGTTPVTVSLPDDRATEVAINLAGYREHKRLVVAPPNRGEVNLDVALTRKQGGGGQGGGPGPLIQDPPLPPPIVDTGAHGYLSVNTNPWTVVHVDGKSVGNTPVVRLRVAAGRHTVLMENRDLGHRRKKTVNVRRDEHVRIVERLD